MQVMNVAGRLTLRRGADRGVDVELASGGQFSSDVQAIYERWEEFIAWAHAFDGDADQQIEMSTVGPPVPRPSQIFAIGVNYRDHAAEAGIDLPEAPMVFTKFPAAVTGPFDEIVLPSSAVDFEVELVVVLGREARNVPESAGWTHVAGLTAGQDLSDREVQLSGSAPQQYNLGKSFEGFAPIGPALVTPDEFIDRDDIGIATYLSGEQMQKSRTSEFVFTVPQLISYLSAILPLRPGDLIFTGTPGGVGWMREPRRTIAAGEELVTEIEGIGQMRNMFVARSIAS
jgi:2-keto-4-pentenoate hydratase/2-oxohepta-3-ene-1,7-dioic acid hydratase in catechol pathway